MENEFDKVFLSIDHGIYAPNFCFYEFKQILNYLCTNEFNYEILVFKMYCKLCICTSFTNKAFYLYILFINIGRSPPPQALGRGLNLRRNKRKLVNNISFRIIFHQGKISRCFLCRNIENRRFILQNVFEFLSKMRCNPLNLIPLLLAIA